MFRQPVKAAYKNYPILVKTHKLTIFLDVLPSKTVKSLKEEVLGALTSKVNASDDVPRVSSVKDFELCVEVKGKGRQSTGEYKLLDAKDVVKNVAEAWQFMFLRFKDDDGKFL